MKLFAHKILEGSLMKRNQYIQKIPFLILGVCTSYSLIAAPITWNAKGRTELKLSTNWNPNNEQRLYYLGPFEMGDNGILKVESNVIEEGGPAVYEAQVVFGSTFKAGDDAQIVVTHQGSPSGLGYVPLSQLRIAGPFNAGEDLTIKVLNTAKAGVGFVRESQIEFDQLATFDGGALIYAYNSGTVGDAQILFEKGFNLLGGKAVIKAINEGTPINHGIWIKDSLGGNANIILKNSKLEINTNFSTFTIGELNGNTASLARSRPTLIINTDPDVSAVFYGSIQNYPSQVSSLIKQGAGSQKLSGTNTYTGMTTINEGSLILNGSIAGDLTINPLGSLKGTGTVHGHVINSGTISPGEENIGTLFFSKNFINNDGFYDVEVNGWGESDLIAVEGTTTLNGGAVFVNSVNGFRFQQPYTILESTGVVSGTFEEATSLAFIDPILTYDLNHVYLTIESAIERAAEGCNQIGVAKNLDDILNPNAEQSALLSSIVNLSLEEAQYALESLSGYQYTSDVVIAEVGMSRFFRHLYDPLRPLISACGQCPTPSDQSCSWTGWVDLSDGFTNIHTKNGHRVNMNSFQITGGAQKQFLSELTLGLAGAYTLDHVKFSHGSRANCDSGFFAAYGLYRPCIFYGLADFAYGYSTHKFDRHIRVGSLSYKAHAKPHISQFAFYGEIGFDINQGLALIQPFFGLQVGKTYRNNVQESNAQGFGLAIKSHHWSTTSSRLGIHATVYQVYNCIDASLDIAWDHRFSSVKSSMTSHFKEFGDAFRICGDSLDKNGVDYAITFSACPCDGMKGYLELGGESWEHLNTFDVIGGFEFSF